MKRLLLIGCVLIAAHATAQHGQLIIGNTKFEARPKSDSSSLNVYIYAEEMPEAGYNLQKYLTDNTRYPSTKGYNIQGRVIVKFIVNDDGSVSDCTVVRGIEPYCDAEAIRVINNMPPWKPGKQGGKAVRVWYTLPILFMH